MDLIVEKMRATGPMMDLNKTGSARRQQQQWDNKRPTAPTRTAEDEPADGINWGWNQHKRNNKATAQQRWKPPMEQMDGYNQKIHLTTAVRMTTPTTTQWGQPMEAIDGSNQWRKPLRASVNDGSKTQWRMTMMGIRETMIPPATATPDRKTSQASPTTCLYGQQKTLDDFLAHNTLVDGNTWNQLMESTEEQNNSCWHGWQSQFDQTAWKRIMQWPCLSSRGGCEPALKNTQENWAFNDMKMEQDEGNW
jgi:hypothetical protein